MDPVIVATRPAVDSAAELVGLMLGAPARRPVEVGEPTRSIRAELARIGAGADLAHGEFTRMAPVVAEAWCPTCRTVVSERYGGQNWSATLHLNHPHPVVIHTRGHSGCRQVAAVVSLPSEYQRVDVMTIPPLPWSPPLMTGPRPVPVSMLPDPRTIRLVDGPAAGHVHRGVGHLPMFRALRPADPPSFYSDSSSVTWSDRVVTYESRIENGGVLCDENDGAVLYWWTGR